MAAVVCAEAGFRRDSHVFHASDGHSYHHNSIMKGGRVSLRCVLYYKRNCMARASVCPDLTEFRQGCVRHNHAPRRYYLMERRFRAAVLNQCRLLESRSQTLAEIYHHVRRAMKFPQLALVNVPFVRLRPSMQRARQENLPNIPRTLSALAETLEDGSNEFLSRSLDEKDNVYLGKFGQTSLGTRCIVIASRRMLDYMINVKEVQSDATFASVPACLEDCYQIWTILTVRRSHIIPLIRVLMQSKTQACYEVVLEVIRTTLPQFNPQKVMCDFEVAQANAWEVKFPLINISGCFFHSSKAIIGRAKEIGLVPLIRESEVVESIVRSLCALALLPFGKIIEGMESISARCNEEGLWDPLSPLLVYVADTWFSPSRLRMLSVYQCKHRTSNACESANATLRATVKQKHPNIWSFLNALLHLEDKAYFDIQVLNSGNTPSRARRASVLANDSRISGLQEDLEEGNISVDLFLRRASRTLQGLYSEILQL